MDEAVRIRIHRIYCTLRSQGVGHLKAIDTIETQLVSSALEHKIGLTKAVTYKSAVRPYCDALNKMMA